jgi:hypothetical protein
MFLLQILLVATLDIKTRDVTTFSSINSLLSQYCKASNVFCKFFGICGGGVPPSVRFAPVVPWAKTGPATTFCEMTQNSAGRGRSLQ